MDVVSFNCPHCGKYLEAPVEMDGETNACPGCKRLVTLHVGSKKAVAAATIVGLALGAFASLFDD